MGDQTEGDVALDLDTLLPKEVHQFAKYVDALLRPTLPHKEERLPCKDSSADAPGEKLAHAPEETVESINVSTHKAYVD